MVKTDIFNPFDGAPIYYKDETESTMEDIRGIESGCHGTVVYAGYQNSGRGRGTGRSWESGKGDNLLMSIILDPSRICHPFIRVPLLAGLAVASLLEEQFGIPALVKWPNDVLVKGRKIAGILCESRDGLVYAGIGLNCRQTSFGEDFRNRATSIALHSQRNSRPDAVLPQLLETLKSVLETSEWKSRVMDRLYAAGSVVYLKEGKPESGGVPVRITDLSDDGFLMVRDLHTGRIRTVAAGEIAFPGLKPTEMDAK